MSLNIIEMSDVIHFINELEDSRIRDLLSLMQSEYSQYTEVGSIEDCKNYKKLCDIPMSQINKLLQVTNKALVDEIDALRKEVKLLKQKR